MTVFITLMSLSLLLLLLLLLLPLRPPLDGILRKVAWNLIVRFARFHSISAGDSAGDF